MQKKAAHNRFFNDILANNPGTIKPEKNGKNDFWGLYPGLNCVKMGIAQKKKKFDTVRYFITKYLFIN